jgi:glycosyltransferase involved in cell wall biosynthesis
MRVCFVAHSAKKGGAEVVLLEAIDILLRAGIECRVVLPDRGVFCGELDRLGVPYSVISYASWMIRGRARFLRGLRAALNIVIKTTFVAWRIFRWKCDVVCTNTVTVCVGAFAARLTRRPHVWNLQEFGFEDHGLSFLFGAPFSYSVISRLSARCICLSRALAEKYARSLDPSKITVIYPSMHFALANGQGVRQDDAGFDHANGRFRCVIVGALTEGKGQEDSILALAHLRQGGTDAELLIAGDGIPEYRHHLEHLIMSHGLRDRVTMAGQVRTALPVMRNSDVVLVCSRCEGFGRVTIEGMLAGKPVIGARGGATAELIQDGVNGLLYDAGDPEDLAAKLRLLIENPGVARRLSLNGQTWARGYFTDERYARDIVRLFAQCA